MARAPFEVLLLGAPGSGKTLLVRRMKVLCNSRSRHARLHGAAVCRVAAALVNTHRSRGLAALTAISCGTLQDTR